MKILHITSILPAPLERKKNENNILIEIARNYQRRYPYDSHSFILIVPYSCWFFSLFKKRWREYYNLIKKKKYETAGFEIAVVSRPGIRGDKYMKKIFATISFYMNRKLLYQIFQDYKPDLIHAHTLSGDSELAQIIQNKNGINYVASTRDLSEVTFQRIKKKNITPLRLLTHNKINLNKIVHHTDIPVYTIPHPVDAGFFIHKLKPTGKTLKLVSIGRLITGKNFDKVIKALSNSSINYTYTIYGSGPMEGKLKSMIVSLGLEEKIHLKGKISHDLLMHQLRSFDLFVMPSAKETFGRVYFEAMASAVPILATRNTGIDGFIKNKKEGYLVNPSDINEIKACIEDYYYMQESDQNKMKQYCMQVAEQANWQKILEQYREFYNINSKQQ